MKLIIISIMLIALLACSVHSASADVKIYGGNTAPVPTGLTNNVTSVAAGLFFYLALKSDGTVIEWEGANSENCHTALPNIKNLKNVVAISACHDQCLAIVLDPVTQQRKVFGYGLNFSGQLDSSHPNQPCFSGAIVKPVLTDIAAVSCGNAHSMALTSNNRVIAWGDNSQGQCNVPGAIQGLVIAISAGGNHSLALLSDNTVWEWGRGKTAKPQHLFVNDPDRILAIAAGNNLSVALRASGKVSAWAEQTGCCVPTINGKTGYVAVTASGGGDYCLALRADGTVDGYGEYSHGQIPLPGCGSNPPCNTINNRTIPTWNNIATIAAGDMHSIALTVNCTTPKAQALYSSTHTTQTDIGGIRIPMIVWLMADAGVMATKNTTGLHITKWIDQSVSGNDFFQNTAAKQPMGNGNGIHFDGTQWLTCGKSAGGLDPVDHTTISHHTIIAYVRVTSPPMPNTTPQLPPQNPAIGLTWNQNRWNAPSTIVGSQMFSMTSGLGVTANAGNADPVYVCFNEVPVGSTFNGNPAGTKFLTIVQSSNHLSLNSSRAHMIAVTDDLNGNLNGNNNIKLYVDADAAVIPGAAPPMHSSPGIRQFSCIGGGISDINVPMPPFINQNEAANLFTGDIYEIIAYSQVLDDAQMSVVYQYLKCKWGI